ncbi:long-chain-acyl-CoA synthetase [Mycobacteroides abscessus subsp. abscessus]|nr:long-chain-acyl-CoA synthetase [Mycobacteroides abscessus subsp. abscessus]
MLDSKLLITEAEFEEAISESGVNVVSQLTIDELDRMSVLAPTANPSATRVLHLHLGHHRTAQGQRDDALPLVAGYVGYRRHGVAVAARRCAVQLLALVSQQRVNPGCVHHRQCRSHLGDRPVVLGVAVLG